MFTVQNCTVVYRRNQLHDQLCRLLLYNSVIGRTDWFALKLANKNIGTGQGQEQYILFYYVLTNIAPI